MQCFFLFDINVADVQIVSDCFFCSDLQISDKNLIDLIRRKVKLNQPYAGVFLKRDDEYGCFLLIYFRHIE